MATARSLLDPSFLKKLERLSLTTRRPFAGQMKGEKRSVKRGASIEFADYREYTPGDDLRYVDWNLAARLDKMFVKLFVEEEDLFLSLLVDSSASMGFGSPTKLDCAVRTAAALGYIGLVNYDRVLVQPYAEQLGRPLPTQRGRAGVGPFLRYLERIEAVGPTSLAKSLRRYAATTRAKGVVVVLSDFLDQDWQEGLKALLARGCQVAAIQILSPEELTPTLRGDIRVVDSETNVGREMSVSGPLLARYQEALAAFCGSIESFCVRYGVDYARADSSSSVEELVLRTLRRGGMLR